LSFGASVVTVGFGSNSFGATMSPTRTTGSEAAEERGTVGMREEAANEGADAEGEEEEEEGEAVGVVEVGVKVEDAGAVEAEGVGSGEGGGVLLAPQATRARRRTVRFMITFL
jgi:hypothetical protein